MKHKIFVSVSIIAALLLLTYVGLVFYIYHMAKQDTEVNSDVIVVLGESAMGGTSCFGPRCQATLALTPHYNVCLEARINQAVSLYKGHYATKIVMSGGTDKSDNVNEADTMKTIAMKEGIPASAILLEDKSTSTYENLVFSQKVLDKAGLHSAIIITDPPTNARAGLVASGLHYNYSLSPDMGTNCAHLSNYVIREPLAIIFYLLTGKI